MAREVPVDLSVRFRNTYEQSKAEAESRVNAAAAAGARTRIYRTAILTGDSRTGWTSKFDGLYALLRLVDMAAELGVSSLPLHAESRLEALTVDSVAEALAALVLVDPVQASGEVLHLTTGTGSPCLLEAARPLLAALGRLSADSSEGQIRSLAFEDGGAQTPDEAREDFERRLPPSLLETVRTQLDALLPYALDATQYDNTRTLERLEPLGVPLLRADGCAEALAGYCLRTKWGALREPRPPATVRLLERTEEDPVVVVGLGAVLPGAPSVKAFRELIQSGRSALGPVPPSRWDASVYGAPPEGAEDRTRCTLGGFVDGPTFEPRDFRIPPVTAASMDRVQVLTLLAAREALGEVGLERLPLDRTRVGCVLGQGEPYLENTYHVGLRVAHRLFSRVLADAFGAGARHPEVVATLEGALHGGMPPLGEDTLAGALANVAAGRVMNAFDLRGPNWVVNAGNASSLAAVEQAVDLLREGACDLVLAGGANAGVGPLSYVNDDARRLLSMGPPRPFTTEASGTVPAEGAVLLALCRLSFARAHGLLPHAALRGLGRAGNGRAGRFVSGAPGALRRARAAAVDQAGEALDGLELGTPGHERTDALERALLEGDFPLGTPRHATLVPQVGHLSGASCGAALLRAVLQVQAGCWLGEPAEGSPRPTTAPRRVGVNAFGERGSAYHAVVGALTEAELHGPPPAAPAHRRDAVPVALVALGAFLPGAPDVRSARALLQAGTSPAAPLPEPLWEGCPDAFLSDDLESEEDTTYGRLGVLAGTPPAQLRAFLERMGLPPSVSSRMDDNHLHLLEAARQVLEDTGWRRAAPDRTAVILGESTSSMRGAWRQAKRLAFVAFEAALRRTREALAPGMEDRAFEARVSGLKVRLLSDEPACDEDSKPGVLVPHTASHLARFLDARGGDCTVDAACASSLAALQASVRELRLGRADVVLGAGVGLTVGPVTNILFARCRALSARWSRPFDASADGILLGEGCVAYVLKRLEDAQRDGDEVLAVIDGMGASSDGRGTAIMAPSAEGQGRAVRRALADAQVAPSEVDWVECHATGTPVGDAAEVESLAVGYETAGRERPLHVGSAKAVWGHTVGAAGAVGLLNIVTSLRAGAIPPTLLRTGVNPHLQLQARNLSVPQAAVPWRAAPNRVRRAGLSSFGFGGTNWHVVLREPPPSPARGWCFVFPGHGAPYPEMGRTLYAQSAAFRASIAEANDTLSHLLGRTFEQLVYEGTAETQAGALYATESVQPLILACNVAFYRAARALGLRPQWLMGHSVGEFSAAVAAGMLTLAEGLTLAHARGRIYRELRDAGMDTGAMLAVPAGRTEVERALSPMAGGVGVAAVNSPDQVVLSGPTEAVAHAAERLSHAGLSCVPLPVEVAWHSELAYRQGAARLREVLAGVEFQPPRVTLIRCAGAEVLSAGAPLARTYCEGFVTQLREPVEFTRMAAAARAAGARRFLELGPRALLTGFLRDTLAGDGVEAVASDAPKRPGHEGLLRAVAMEGVRHGG